MRSHFRFSVLAVAAATLVIFVIMSSSTRFEEKANAATSGALKISQFRENGPGGTGSSVASQDEFIEIYNNTDSLYTVGTTDSTNGTGGIGVFASAGNGVTDNVVTLVCRIPDGTAIPARSYVLCVNVNGYSLDTLGSTNSTTGGGTNPGPVAITGGVLTNSRGNFPIVNGTVANPGAFACQAPGCVSTGMGLASGVGTSVDIPNDAGLVLINIGTNTVGASINVPDNGSFGFIATGVAPANITIFDRVGVAPYGAGALSGQKCQLLIAPAGCGLSNARPSLADNYCEGGPAGCLRPVGDASTTTRAVVFYGDSGQYALLRRQSALTPGGTVPRDTDNNGDDFLMVAPFPAINIAAVLTGFPAGVTNGLVSVLGSAGPHNSAAPADLGEGALVSRLFDLGRTSGQLPNAERRYVIDNAGTPVNAGNMATTIQNNNPQGSYILRFGFRNTSTTTAINRLRVRIDQLAVPCGQASPSPAAAVTGSGEARNLTQTAPNCQGAETRTAVLKMLNMPTELVARETTDPLSPATNIVRGGVIEDTSKALPGGGGHETAPNGGGINNSLVRTGATQGSLVGESTTTISPSGSPFVAGDIFYMAFRMGVVKGGTFRFIFQPEGGTSTSTPAPTVTPVP